MAKKDKKKDRRSTVRTLRPIDKNRREKRPRKTVTTVSEEQEKKELPKMDLDWSTARKKAVGNADKRFISYIVYDNHSEQDVEFCEMIDYLDKDTRKELKEAGILE